jgi:anti-sigma factor ChrR (cupin superfamily)
MNDDNTLNPAWTGQLAQSMRPSNGLSEQARERIKRQVMQSISASPAASELDEPNIRNVRREEGWQPLGKRMQVKVLHDDGRTLSWLLKLLPGGGLPVHDHADGAEECMVMEGSLRINGVEFQAGDYQIALPGSQHDEVFSETGSLVYLRSPSSRRKDLMGA